MFSEHLRTSLLVATIMALGASGIATIHAIVNDSAPEEPSEEEQSFDPSAYRPRLRKEDRDALHEEHRQQEVIGEEVSRMREWMEKEGLDIDIDALREQATARLEQATTIHMAAPSLSEIPHQPMEIPAPKGACFRSDGSTTFNRDECDPDQGRHFGFRQEPQHPGAPAQTFIEEQMQERFGEFSHSTYAGPNVIEIIGEALQRLGSKVSAFADQPEIQSRISDTIRWLSSVLADYANREPTPNESMQLANEIKSRLESVMSAMGGSSMQYGHMPQGGGSMMGPPPGMAKGIIMMMDRMMTMLPRVISIFEENGIPVSSDARSAAEEARTLFEQIRPACEADPMACMRLRDVGTILETRMRPPMEQAMMASGNMQLGMQIERMMADEGMMGPPSMMEHMGPPDGFGPPPGFDSMHMGAPEGFGPPSDFGPPGMMGDIQSRMMQCMMNGGNKSDCMNQVMGSGFPR